MDNHYRVQPPAWMYAVKPGKFDVRIMNQTRLWIDRYAAILIIDDLRSTHIANIMTMLQSNARRYHLAALIDPAVDMFEEMVQGRPSGELLAYELTGHNPADV